MISPNTPPGTEVIALGNAPAVYGLKPLKKGRTYIIARIVKTTEGWGVVVAGMPVGRFVTEYHKVDVYYSLRAFRYLVHDPLDATLETRAPLDA